MSEEEKTAKVEKEEPEKKPEAAKVEGSKVIIDGREYDPQGALDLIHKLRPYEKKTADLEAELAKYKAEETKRKQDELSAIEKAELERDDFKQKYEGSQKELEDLKIENQKREIADEVGLPAAFALRIKGATPDEMRTDAKELLGAMPKARPTTSTTNPGQNTLDKESWADQAKRLGLLP